MENRIVRYFTGLEALLAPDTPVSPEHPITLWIGRDVLAAVLEDNLANIEQNRVRELESPIERQQLDRVTAERQAFLRWVEAWEGANIFCGVFPCTEYEPQEDRSDRGDGSDDGPPPLSDLP